MKIELTKSELSLIAELIQQEINYYAQEPEHDDEIKDAVNPYERLLKKLNKIGASL